MKKVFTLFAFAVLGILTANAQMIQVKPCKLKSNPNTNSANARQVSPSTANHTMSVLWSDDFSNPANWVISHAPGTSDDWVIGTSGPVGAFAIQPINSVSAPNGFALFDSDNLCSHDQIANITTANPIDMSANQYVRLSFSQYYEKFHDSTYVYVSNDGNTWTRFIVNGNLANLDYSGENDAYENPNIVNIDISSVAANQDSVYIRFQFYSPDTNLTTVDPNAGCAYSWMIDDVSLNDIKLTDGALVTAYCGEYNIIPTIQSESFQVRGKIFNNGVLPITGARIKFVINDPIGNQTVDTSVVSGTINPGDTSAFLNAMGTYIPAVGNLGQYFIEQTLILPGDSDASNDVSIGMVILDDSLYGRDVASITDITDFRGTVGFSGSPISFGEIFHFSHTSQLSSALFFLFGATLGDHVSVTVYNTSAGAPAVAIGSTGPYTITPLDTGNTFLTLAFPTWITVYPGDYFISVDQLDTNNLTLGISKNIYTLHSCYYNLDGSGWATFETSRIKRSLMLEVNNPSSTLNVGVKELTKQSLFNVYPNPSSGMLYINGNGSVEKEVTVKVIDGLGQVVKTSYFKSFMNGKIDLSDFPAGVYTVNIRSTVGEENKNIVLQ